MHGDTCSIHSDRFLYPRTEFTREYGIPIHDSLVNCVWEYRIPVVHFVFIPDVDTYPLLTRRQRRVSSRQQAGSANEILLKYFANVGPRKEAEWQHAQAVGNGSMKTVWHCHKSFGPNLILNGLVLAVFSVCNIVFCICTL